MADNGYYLVGSASNIAGLDIFTAVIASLQLLFFIILTIVINKKDKDFQKFLKERELQENKVYQDFLKVKESQEKLDYKLDVLEIQIILCILDKWEEAYNILLNIKAQWDNKEFDDVTELKTTFENAFDIVEKEAFSEKNIDFWENTKFDVYAIMCQNKEKQRFVKLLRFFEAIERFKKVIGAAKRKFQNEITQDSKDNEQFWQVHNFSTTLNMLIQEASTMNSSINTLLSCAFPEIEENKDMIKKAKEDYP